MSSENVFSVWDYLVVGATLALSLFIGIFYALIGKQTNEELLMGGRQMNVFAISASMLVTYLSAITVIGYPAEIYANGLQIFISTILSLVFVPVSCYMFISVFYKMKLTSVYEYLELRFGTMMVRRLASLSFILQGCVITGVVLYAPSIALERILGFPVWVSIVSIGICGTIYTSIGGLKAVVWTDVFQFIMIIIGMIAIIIKGMTKAGGFTQAFKIAGEHGRLNLIDWTIDPFMRHNTLNFLLGTGFSIICLYGTHQPQVQRYCSLETLGRAMKAVALSVLLKIVTMSLVVLTGIAIFATYVGCDPILLKEIKKSDQIVPHFVINELSFIPGIVGLFVACVISAVLSTVSSALNSLSAVTWEDFASHIPAFKRMSGRSQSNFTRLTALFYGVLCIGLAFIAQQMGSIFQAAMTAVGAFSGPLGAIFLMGLFMPCVNKWGAMLGMLTGLCSMIFVTIMSFNMKKPYHVPLPTNVDSCPFSAINNTVDLTISSTETSLIEIEWPEKIFTLSYILYPFVGGIITITIGLIVSIATRGCSDAKQIDRKYLHPILQKVCCFPAGQEIIPPVSTYQRADRLSGLYVYPNASNPDLYYNYKYDIVPTKIIDSNICLMKTTS